MLAGVRTRFVPDDNREEAWSEERWLAGYVGEGGEPVTRAALAVLLASAVPSPGWSQDAGTHLSMCSGHPTIEECLDKLFGSGNWDRWGDTDINRYSEAMGLARWKGGRREWAKCDTLNHFTSETVFPSGGNREEVPRSRHAGQAGVRVLLGGIPHHGKTVQSRRVPHEGVGLTGVRYPSHRHTGKLGFPKDIRGGREAPENWRCWPTN